MALTDEERIKYLANVVSAARADGQISPRENEAISNIQKNIGAKKTEINKAHTVAESPGFEMQPVGIFSDRVKNLEDIIYISLVDGRLDKEEKRLVLAFVKTIGITQSQINTILKEVKSNLSSAGATSCPNCGASIKGTVKFCPHCGSAVAEADKKKAVSVGYELPRAGISVEFAESTASGFAHAVQVAQTAPINATAVKGKKTWYMASWPSNHISETTKLVENLKGMRNRKVYIDGVEAKWDEVFGFTSCAEQRNTAYRPLEYCFGLDEKSLNIWGCKQSCMDWTDWADWFGYGAFKKIGLLKNQVVFVFDKKRIRHELQTNLYRFRFCPHLRFDLIEAVLEVLPDEVKPTEKGPWTYKRDYNESPGSIQVKMKVVEDEYTYNEEFSSSGVVPKDSDLSIDILKKAFQNMGVAGNEIKGILAYKE
ncbi:MAG: zinc-ribbon domain-containing protein [Candidatus Marinimicrobia bacterium]|jgi:uncharacterized tellurite resistance protein B-like protein|nr:zinc-ribbon domain-containing protein [Candidatus Neomarinimicrobiota bacterium]